MDFEETFANVNRKILDYYGGTLNKNSTKLALRYQ